MAEIKETNEDVPEEQCMTSTITMVDVLEQELEEEEESAAVLGGSDEKCCTYQKGYIKRQALYSCLTCCPQAKTDPSKRAGICLGCSYQCHEGHELIELYTKRKFRCDCPTKRLEATKCIMNGIQDINLKFPPNDENTYNQNFSGKYCTCQKPYPDPDDSIEDEMIQCIACEDWYHTRHLNIKVPPADTYTEMICGDCMEKYSFLKDYVDIAINSKINPIEDDEDLSMDDEKLKSELDKSISEIMNISELTDIETTIATSSKTEHNENEPPTKKLKVEEGSSCVRIGRTSTYTQGATFWPNNWRTILCKCSACLAIYNELKILYLLDSEDTVQCYEDNGLKKKRETTYERGIRALSSLDRVQQIDAISEYNRMKDKLKEYLHPFVVNKKVVTEEDINRFFQGMRNDRNSALGQPFFCR